MLNLLTADNVGYREDEHGTLTDDRYTPPFDINPSLIPDILRLERHPIKFLL